MGDIRHRAVRRESGHETGRTVRVKLRTTEFDAIQFNNEQDNIPGLTVIERLPTDEYPENTRMVIIGDVATLAEFGDWVILVDGEAATILTHEDFKGLYEEVPG